MTLSLLIGYALTVMPLPELPQKPEDRVKRWLAELARNGNLKRLQGTYLDNYLHLNLELARSRQGFSKGMIAFRKKLVTEYGDVFTAEQTLRLLREIEADWAEVDKQEKWIQALLWCQLQRQLNPKRETADEAKERLEQFRSQLWPPPRRES